MTATKTVTAHLTDIDYRKMQLFSYDKTKALQLSKRQHKLLLRVKASPEAFTAGSLVEQTGISFDYAKVQLNTLVEMDYLYVSLWDFDSIGETREYSIRKELLR